MLFIAIWLGTTTISRAAADAQAAQRLASLDHVRRGTRIVAINAIDCPRAWQPLRMLVSYATGRRDADVNHFDTTEGQSLELRLHDAGCCGPSSRA